MTAPLVRIKVSRSTFRKLKALKKKDGPILWDDFLRSLVDHCRYTRAMEVYSGTAIAISRKSKPGETFADTLHRLLEELAAAKEARAKHV